MKKALLIIAFLGFQITTAQVIDKPKEKINQVNEDKICPHTEVDIKPEFPEGLQVFYKVLRKFEIPKEDEFKGEKILIEFVIEKDGSLTNSKVLKDCGFNTREQALKLFVKSSKWKPAKKRKSC